MGEAVPRRADALDRAHSPSARREDHGRRLGSLTTLTPEQIESLLRGRLYGHVMPTYKQAKLAAWDMLQFYAQPIPGALPNEAELSIRYPNGSKIQLFGADNPDALRGPGF